ncbi:MAG: DUF4388 domain-containing protein [Candidatus Zixiibacteriota bacterium]
MRLDTILIDDQLVLEQQVEEAREYQTKYGGRLETHLYRFGYADEAILLKALSRQFNCPGVTLVNRRIADEILNMLMPEIALTYIILPFDFDPAHKKLMIACERPPETQLTDKLSSMYPEKKFEFYLALGPVLKTAIINFYRSSLASQISETGPDQTNIARGEECGHDASKKLDKHSRLLICNDNHMDIAHLEHSLNDNNFEYKQAYSISEFADIYEQFRPNILLLIKNGNAADITEHLGGIISRGVSIEQIPTLLLTDRQMVDSMMHTLNTGIEDVIAMDARDTIILKLNRLRTRLDIERKRRLSVIQDLGTHGTLEDMNVIDIIQAMGPSEKTARISITGCGKHLTIFLDRGNIIYAECEDKTGPEAVYLAIPWDRGIWSVDPIGPEELPEPNNFQSNESILLEGCYQLDEANRDNQFECNFLE